ncbi:MAG: ankyrin repeat domain-containing protein [Tepidisphaerales bacterium]
MSAQVDALVKAAGDGDLAAMKALLIAHPGLAKASRPAGDGEERAPALCRAAAKGQAAAVKLLLEHGADPNAMFRDDYGTALTAACETLAPGTAEVVEVLLAAGADPGLADALYMACSTWARNPVEKHRIVRMLMAAGETADQHPAVLAVHAGDAKALTNLIARDPGLTGRRFTEVDYLAWPLHCGAPTLLHIAADYGETALVQLLLAAGTDVNVRAGPGENGCGYQTPVFHCVASENGCALGVLKLLIERRADLGVTAKVHFPEEARGICPEAGQTVELRPLGLAMRFEKATSRNSAEAIRLLREAGAVE